MIRHPGFDDHIGAVAKRLLDLQVFDFLQQFSRLKGFDHLLARLEPVEPAIVCRDARRISLTAIHNGGNGIQNVQRRVARALADFKIVEVVRRGDFHRARTLFGVCIVISNDRHAAANNRQLHELADQARIALIFRVHGHTGIAQHGFRTGRRDNDIVARLGARDIALFILDWMLIGNAIGQRISQMPVMARHFALVDFEV